MVDWLAGGGCINGIRYADEGGSPIDFIANADTDVDDQVNDKVIIISISLDSDDMNDTSGDFFLEWQNQTDASGWNDLSATGELTWGLTSDYANGDNTPVDRLNGTENCSGMGVTPAAVGVQRENANEINLTNIADDTVLGHEFCVSLSGALAGKAYEFRISESGGGSNVYKTFTAVVNVVAAGRIDLVTRNRNRSAVEGNVKVVAFESDGGSPAGPTGEEMATGTSDGNGVLSLTGMIISGRDYILVGAKGSGSTIQSDATSPVTAVAL